MNHRFAVAIEESVDNTETVAEHFGHCSKFIICEIDELKQLLKTEIYFNPMNGHHGGTCQLPAYIKQFEVSTIIAGGMGKKAINNFHQEGIEVITAPGLKFEDAFQQYINGNLSGYEECAGHGHNHGHSHNGENCSGRGHNN